MRDAGGQHRFSCGIVHDFAWDLHVSMAGADKEVSEMEAGIKRAGIDAALLAVIVKLPFQITVSAGAQTQLRDHRRKPARIGNKSYSGEIGGGRKYVLVSRHKSPAKSGDGKVTHLDIPAYKLTRAPRPTV